MADLKTEYEKTYIAIKEAILIGEFTPGQKLPQRKLAQRFNATTMTVREALRTLEKENLIQIVPKWGAMVIELMKCILFVRLLRVWLPGWFRNLSAASRQTN